MVMFSAPRRVGAWEGSVGSFLLCLLNCLGASLAGGNPGESLLVCFETVQNPQSGRFTKIAVVLTTEILRGIGH